ncbi:hypothetical protein JCM8097_001818 [Rhodosporidiobolus ruineniae]
MLTSFLAALALGGAAVSAGPVEKRATIALTNLPSSFQACQTTTLTWSGQASGKGVTVSGTTYPGSGNVLDVLKNTDAFVVVANSKAGSASYKVNAPSGYKVLSLGFFPSSELALTFLLLSSQAKFVITDLSSSSTTQAISISGTAPGFLWSGGKCVACPTNASTCSSATVATQCNDGFYLQPNKTSKTCEQCTAPAATCSSATVATSCKEGFYLKGNACVDDCGNEFFKDAPQGQIAKCSACASTALKCSSATVATECKDGNFLAADGSCGGTCSGATFPNSTNKKCDACTDQFAATCDAEKSLTCKENHFIVEATNKCAEEENGCPAKTYLATTVCKACGDNVTACNAGGASACDEGFLLYQNHCVNGEGGCPKKSYLSDSTTCTDCSDQYAETCDAEKALSCDNGHYLVEPTGECTEEEACPPNRCTSTQCDSALYLDGTTCKACGNGVTACDADGPSSCIDGRVIQNGNCDSTSCDAGSFNDSAIAKCSDCGSNALVCTSATQATECEDEFYLRADGSCQKTCEAGFFAKSSSKTCERCSEHVATCSADAALSCEQGWYLKDNGCTNDCGDGFFPQDASENSPAQCTRCAEGVAKCKSLTEATACADENYLREDKTCKPDCLDGSFKNAQAKTCDQCAAPAATCTSATVATSCKEGFYLKDSVCVDDCGNGFFKDAPQGQIAKCSACASTALKCSSATVATECKDGNFLAADGSCGTTCSGATFPNSANKKCDACPDQFAATCDAEKTLTCQKDHYIVESTGQCYNEEKSCPPKTYLAGTECRSCGQGAATCNAEGALSCDGTLVVSGGQCKDHCDAGFFKKNGVCTQCSGFAATCDDNDKPTSCSTGHKFVPKTQSCTEGNTCPRSTYDDGRNSCIACDGFAATCDASGALSCNGKLYLSNHACVPECPSQTYPNNKNECVACSDPNAASCPNNKSATCVSGKLLNTVTGLCTTGTECPVKTFRDSQSCKACKDKSAYTCSATAATNCYQAPGQSPKYLLQGQCVSNLECRLSKWLVLAYLQQTKAADGTTTYTCASCPKGKIPSLDGSKCIG